MNVRLFCAAIVIVASFVTASSAFAIGAFDYESTVEYVPEEDINPRALITDAQGRPALLAGTTFGSCALITFDGDTAEEVLWGPEGGGAVTCWWAIPGPEGGWIVRGGYDALPRDEPESNFAARITAEGETAWFQLDSNIDERSVNGGYLGPATQLAWQDDRDRVLVMFVGGTVIMGTPTPFIHAAVYAENTGNYFTLIADFGSQSDGDLVNVLAMPDSRFLVGIVEIGTYLFAYDGNVSVDAVTFDGIDLTTLHATDVRYDDQGLLNLTAHPYGLGTDTSDTRYIRAADTGEVSVDVSTARTIMVDDDGELVESVLETPFDMLVGDDVMTLLRPDEETGQLWWHTFDLATGNELTVQPMTGISERPLYVASDLPGGDAIGIVEGAGPEDNPNAFYFSILEWDPTARAPGDARDNDPGGNPDDADVGVGGDDTGEGSGGSPGGDDDRVADSGGCAVASRGAASLPLVLGLFVVATLRRSSLRLRAE